MAAWGRSAALKLMRCASVLGNVFVAGDGGGLGGARAALAQGTLAGLAVVADVKGGLTAAQRTQSQAQQRALATARGFQAGLWQLFAPAHPAPVVHTPDTLLCRCEGVRFGDVDAEKVKDVFTDLEFRTLARRVIGEEIVVTASAAPVSKSKGDSAQLDLFGVQSMLVDQDPTPTADYKTIATEKPSYHLITSPEERKELLEILLQQKEVCFDTETTDLDALHADLVGMSFSYKAREAFYVAVPKDFEEAKSIVKEFEPFFYSTSIEKIAHNIKYDLKVLNRYGIHVAAPTFDTMIAHYLINPESKQGMDFLAEFYLKYQPISIETLIGKKGKGQGNMGDLKPEEISDYACEDADITLQLKKTFEPEIQKEHLKELFYNMEMPLVEVLKDMEQ